MNKILAISLITVLSFTLTGCSLLNKAEGPKEDKKSEKSQQENKNEKGKKDDDKNVFSSIKDAVTKQIGLKCEYVDEEGVKATTYIKGSNVYMESEIDNESMKTKFKGVMKDQKYYMWNDNNKQGMVFDLTKMSANNSKGSELKVQSVQSQEQIIERLEQNKSKCNPENISASMFETPSDVTFVEWNLSN